MWQKSRFWAELQSRASLKPILVPLASLHYRNHKEGERERGLA